MIEKCFDEGTMQAFLDGELAPIRVEQVSQHIALCDVCAVAIAEAEAEMAVTFSALDREFDTLVPTQRLWAKINNLIEAQNRSKTLWQSVYAFLTSSTSVAFASLLIVFGLFVGLYSLKTGKVAEPVAKINQSNQTVDISINGSENIPAGNPSTNPPNTGTPDNTEDSLNNSDDRNYRIVKAIQTTGENYRNSQRAKIKEPNAVGATPGPMVAEDSFIRTIETLERSVDGRKDAVLDPSARFAYEKDMALTSTTIDRLKGEVRRNPNNKTARELLRTSYQNKINLLNSVAEKTELMAILN